MPMPAMILDSDRRRSLDTGFLEAFGRSPRRYFSAPGRTEIGGNHTDHQRGRVLAAAVDLDTCAAVDLNGGNFIQILSRGYDLCRVDIRALEPVPREANTTAALVRGWRHGLPSLAAGSGALMPMWSLRCCRARGSAPQRPLRCCWGPYATVCCSGDGSRPRRSPGWDSMPKMSILESPADLWIRSPPP